jgi:hypothetical protein
MTSPVRTLPTPLSLNDFDVGVTLGTGSFGRVRFATHKVYIFFPLFQNILFIYIIIFLIAL